jgi:PIN domain nuclease of toxin-antitoxin system
LLLDTHVVIWWAIGSSRLPAAWIEVIVDPDNEVLVSAASAWEVEIKKLSGKLFFSPSVVEVVQESGFTVLPISAEDATLAGSLDWEHRDPFDRMIAVQSVEHALTVVTHDEVLRAAPGIRVL